MARVRAEDSELARRKVFSRRQLVVAVAPHLYGWTPQQVEAVVDQALADPSVVPLIGVSGAIEPTYSLASVLATEGAIADSFEATWAAPTPPPPVPTRPPRPSIRPGQPSAG